MAEVAVWDDVFEAALPRRADLSAGVDLSGVALERLEHDMLTLSGHIAAATCSFLLMVGEYDARAGWESWEAYSCAHWLNWRCGVGMVAAREQVRVARALRELPAVTAAFSAGEVSYSKVRAITRVAHPGNEAELVEMARFATAAQLERAVSRLRRSLDPAEVVESEERSQALRSLRWQLELNGDLVVRARIPAGAAADAFRSQIAARLVTEPAEGEPFEDLDARRLDSLLDGLAAGADVDASLAMQPEVIVHFHTELPADTFDPATPADQGPHSDVLVGGGPSDASAVSPPAPRPDEESPQGDPSTAPRARARAGWRLPHPADRPDPAMASRGPAHDSAGSPAELQRLTTALRASLTPALTSTGAHVSTRRARALISDAGVRAVLDIIDPTTGDVTTVDLGRHDRTPNRALRRAVMHRDHGCCRFPGCHRRHRLHVHHIVWWEHGGPTVADNLLLLCPKHHHAIHDRHWELTGTADAHTFRRPDGVTADPAAALLCGATAELVDAHRRHGVDIAADGAGSHWTGDQIDWHCFDAAFANGRLTHDPRHAPQPAGSDTNGVGTPSLN